MTDLFEEADKGFAQLYCGADCCKKITDHGITGKYVDDNNSSNDYGYFECQECKSTIQKKRFQ